MLGSFTYGARGGAGKALIAAIFLCLGAMQAAAERVHVIAFGDSLTAGYGLMEEEGFVPVLRRWLEERGEDAEIVQAGVSGETTAGGLARLDWALTPEIGGIILELGGNDILRGLSPEQAKANLRAMLEICRDRGLEVLLVGVPVAANYGADYKARFEAIWPDLAEEFGVALYPDFMAALGDDPAAALSLMQDDGIHPNAEGVRRIVADIGPEVRRLLVRMRAE